MALVMPVQAKRCNAFRSHVYTISVLTDCEGPIPVIANFHYDRRFQSVQKGSTHGEVSLFKCIIR